MSGLKGTYQQRLKELNMLFHEDRRRLSDLVQVFKIVHGIYKVDLNTWFTLVRDNPARATRATSDALNFVRPVARSEVRRSFYSVRVVDTWNTLPGDIKRAQSVPAFRNQVENLISQLHLMRGSSFLQERSGPTRIHKLATMIPSKLALQVPHEWL